jgi:hypothetical protein
MPCTLLISDFALKTCTVTSLSIMMGISMLLGLQSVHKCWLYFLYMTTRLSISSHWHNVKFKLAACCYTVLNTILNLMVLHYSSL